MSTKQERYDRVVRAAKAARIVERSIFDQYGEAWILDFDTGFRYHLIDMSDQRNPIDWGWWHSFGAAVQKLMENLQELKLDTSQAVKPNFRYTVG